MLSRLSNRNFVLKGDFNYGTIHCNYNTVGLGLYCVRIIGHLRNVPVDYFWSVYRMGFLTQHVGNKTMKKSAAWTKCQQREPVLIEFDEVQNLGDL